jgi:hypothetical protein
MADEIDTSDDFLVTFPLWVLVHPVARWKGMITVKGVSGEKAVPLFTDDDLAERFKEPHPELGHYLIAPVMAAQLPQLLDAIEAEGFTHVTVDAAGPGQHFYRIDTVRRALSRPGASSGENGAAGG